MNYSEQSKVTAQIKGRMKSLKETAIQQARSKGSSNLSYQDEKIIGGIDLRVAIVGRNRISTMWKICDKKWKEKDVLNFIRRRHGLTFEL